MSSRREHAPGLRNGGDPRSAARLARGRPAGAAAQGRRGHGPPGRHARGARTARARRVDQPAPGAGQGGRAAHRRGRGGAGRQRARGERPRARGAAAPAEHRVAAAVRGPQGGGHGRCGAARGDAGRPLRIRGGRRRARRHALDSRPADRPRAGRRRDPHPLHRARRGDRRRDAGRVARAGAPAVYPGLCGGAVHRATQGRPACHQAGGWLSRQTVRGPRGGDRVPGRVCRARGGHRARARRPRVRDQGGAGQRGRGRAPQGGDARHARAPPLAVTQAAVETRNLTRRFGALTAVRQLTLRIEEGEVFGLLGPNGSGKTTTIRMLCGLLEPSEGQGTVAEIDVTAAPEQVKQRIGYMAQKVGLYEDLTTAENLDFYAGIYGLRGAAKQGRLAQVAAFLDLGERLGQLAGELSGGWKQRLALACALIHEPALLVLDEPTAGVDPAPRRRFWRTIHALAQAGTTVLVTTHYMEEAEQCGRLAMMSRGHLIALGSPAEVAAQVGGRTLEDAFVILQERDER